MTNQPITKKVFYLVIQSIIHPHCFLDKGTIIEYDTDDDRVYFYNKRIETGGHFSIRDMLKHSDFFKEISKEEVENRNKEKK
jgi:hypothetical protein